jgi:hypothetical protein
MKNKKLPCCFLLMFKTPDEYLRLKAISCNELMKNPGNFLYAPAEIPEYGIHQSDNNFMHRKEIFDLCSLIQTSGECSFS